MEGHVTFQNLMPVKTLLSFQPRRHPQEKCLHPSFSPPVATLVPPKSSLGGQRTSRRSTKARGAGRIRRRGVLRTRRKRSVCRRISRLQIRRWQIRSAEESRGTTGVASEAGCFAQQSAVDAFGD